VVVIDNYAAAAPEERALRDGGRVLMAVDDLADRPHDVDVLLDAGYGRRAEDYAGLAPEDAELLIGTAYALLRPAFATAHARPGEVRQDLRRVFLSFGLSDVGGVTARALETIRPLAPDAELDIAIGQDAASLPELRVAAERDRKIRLHVEATDVVELMQGADLAVGGGGGATWERCCLGLPSIAVIVAENQRPAISALAADGVLVAVDMARPDWEGALKAAVERLRPPAVRSELQARSLAVCDGRGAERAAAALLSRLETAS